MFPPPPSWAEQRRHPTSCTTIATHRDIIHGLSIQFASIPCGFAQVGGQQLGALEPPHHQVYELHGEVEELELDLVEGDWLQHGDAELGHADLHHLLHLVERSEHECTLELQTNLREYFTIKEN